MIRLELDTPALERLIGGDTEVEANLRQKIVEAFARRHLKALMNSHVFTSLSAEWSAQISQEVKNFMDQVAMEKQRSLDQPRPNNPLVLNLRSALDTAINAALKTLTDRVEAYIRVQEGVWMQRIDTYITDTINHTMRNQAQIQLTRILAEVADKLKFSLGQETTDGTAAD